jgi:hypothetical protein
LRLSAIVLFQLWPDCIFSCGLTAVCIKHVLQQQT